MSRDQFAYEKFISALNEYKTSKNLTLDELVKLLDCTGISSAGFLSEVMKGKKKANAAMVFAFENLLFEEKNKHALVIAEPTPVFAVANTFESLRPDQDEVLKEWERLTEEERQAIMSTIKLMKGRV